MPLLSLPSLRSCLAKNGICQIVLHLLYYLFRVYISTSVQLYIDMAISWNVRQYSTCIYEGLNRGCALSGTVSEGLAAGCCVEGNCIDVVLYREGDPP